MYLRINYHDKKYKLTILMCKFLIKFDTQELLDYYNYS